MAIIFDRTALVLRHMRVPKLSEQGAEAQFPRHPPIVPPTL